MKKALFLLGFFCSFDAVAQGYYVPAAHFPSFYQAPAFPYYPVPYPSRPNPYTGGIGMNSYAGNRALSVRSAPPSPRAFYVPARTSLLPEKQGVPIGEDTAFFKQYIREHPDVMPDIKLKGTYEW